MASEGWTWTWQRCGRYKYQKVLVHTTNPDHLVPSTPSLTDIPPLQSHATGLPSPGRTPNCASGTASREGRRPSGRQRGRAAWVRSRGSG